MFAYGIPGMLIFVTTNLILEAMGYQKAGMYVMIFVNILNVIFNGIFIQTRADVGADLPMHRDDVKRRHIL